MSTTNGTADAATAFGSCDDDDLEDLDHAMTMVRAAETFRKAARHRAARVMDRMLTKDAQRKAIAARAGVNDQTVSNMIATATPPTPAERS